MSELQGLQSRIADIHAADGEVLAVSVDEPETTKEKLGEQGFTFPLLADPDLATIDAYGVRHPSGGMGGTDVARPATFVIDRDGKIAWRDLSDNWRKRPRAEQVLAQVAAIP